MHGFMFTFSRKTSNYNIIIFPVLVVAEVHSPHNYYL